MGEGKLTPLTTPTPLNRQSRNIAHVITPTISPHVPHLVKIAPGVTSPHIAKVTTQFFYRQACALRSHAGIVFTQWSKMGSSPRHVAPINVKFGTPEKNVGIQSPKLSKFRISAINVYLRGDSFAIFLRNSQRLYASIGSF